MSAAFSYEPPKVWTASDQDFGRFATINRPESGARYEAKLPRGKHPLQLYSQGTPNGKKVTILLEELLAAGVSSADYDAHLISIMKGEQFSSGFVAVNPNSKIPALLDTSETPPTRVFESGAILLYLAEKFRKFLPLGHAARTEALNWLFWLQGAAPYIGGGFGHFYAYATTKQKYPIDRFTMETKRMLDVVDKRLAEARYLGGTDYSIADIAAWPWIGGLMNNEIYHAAQFLDVERYKNVRRWTDEIGQRKAVQRGRIVNTTGDDRWPGLRERHSASDIDAALATLRAA